MFVKSAVNFLNPLLGTLDFTGSEHEDHFSLSTELMVFFFKQKFSVLNLPSTKCNLKVATENCIHLKSVCSTTT